MLLITKKHVTNSGLLALVLLLAGMSIVAMACGTETVEVTREVEVVVEVEKEVEVEKQIQVEVTREVEVVVEVEKEVEVEKQIQVEVTREVEVVVEVEKEVEVEKQIQVEVTREVEVVVEVEKEVVVEKEVMVEVTAEVEKDTVIFSDLNWTSSELQVRIAKYIVEHGYGYPTDTVAGDTISLFEGLKNNDTDVTMEIWLPNQQEVWDSALESGAVVDVGKSLEDNWQGFVIPQYVLDANPGLVSVSDIPEHMDLFVTPDSNGKARLITCIPGWQCEIVNAEKVVAYGLEDAVELTNPGSSAGLFADLEAAYARGDPWIGYLWGPTKPSSELDLYILEEPPYTEDCWAVDKGCAYPTAEIKIAVHESLIDRAPELVQFFRRWDFTAKSQIATEAWMGENNETTDAAAINYLQNFSDLWEEYVPEDVAARVHEALAQEG